MKVELTPLDISRIRWALQRAAMPNSLNVFESAIRTAEAEQEALAITAPPPLYFWLGAEAEKVYDHT